MNKQINKWEILGGLVLTVIVFAIGLSITDTIRHSMERSYLRYQQAVKLTDGGQLKYAIETNVGDILTNGSIKALEPKKMSEIKGEYSIVRKIKEHYTMHARTVSYSCGTAKNPRTCTRVETYYTWDEVDREVLKSNKYKIIESEVSNLCEPPMNDLNLDEVYQGDKHHTKDYVYPDYSSGFFGGKGDDRISYQAAPLEFNGTVFMRAFTGKVTNPLNEKDCLPLFYQKDISQAMEQSKPNFILVTFGFIFILIIIIGSYSYWTAENEF